MVEQVVRLTVSFSVTDAQMSAFKSIAAEMTEGTRPEPGTLGYEWFVSADGKRFRLVETYVDAAPSRRTSWARWCSSWCRNLQRSARWMDSNSMGIRGPRSLRWRRDLERSSYQYWMGIGR